MIMIFQNNRTKKFAEFHTSQNSEFQILNINMQMLSKI